MNSKIIGFAIESHSKVNHLYDGKPYSLHLSMVASYAMKYIDHVPSQCQETVLNACWLHDTIEDCRLSYNDILKVAGENVANIVYAVSNEKGKNRKERASDLYYFGIRNTAWAIYVKLCDRLANIKYSKDTKSKMFEVYKKENFEFIEKLFPNSNSSTYCKDMIDELYDLLRAQ